MRAKLTTPARQFRSTARRYRRDLDRLDASFVRARKSWRRNVARAPEPSDFDDHDARAARVAAVLFLSREPLNTRKIGQYAKLADGTEARTMLRRLNKSYDERGRSFRVEEVAGGYQLLTRPQFASWLRRLGHIPAETRLSAPAMETLSVVAYRQPVIRAEIEAIRGVSCGEILRQLMDRELIRIEGRSEELGRPFRYATTKRFLQTFGLRTLEDLPRSAALRLAETVASEAKVDDNSSELHVEVTVETDER